VFWPIDKARLRALRLARGLSLDELAARSGQSVRTLQRLESPGGSERARPFTHHCLTKALGEPEGALRLTAPASGAATDDAPPAAPGPTSVRVTFAPALSSLESLVEREHRGGLGAERAAALPLVTATLLQDVLTLFAAHIDRRVVVRGCVIAQRGLFENEVQALGATYGASARFVLARDVVPGCPLLVTVLAPDAKAAKALQEALTTRAPVEVEATVVAWPGGGRGFVFWGLETPKPWAFVTSGPVRPAAKRVALTWEPSLDAGPAERNGAGSNGNKAAAAERDRGARLKGKARATKA
jgi:transcriptional regulator with XRE-family HTH domain